MLREQGKYFVPLLLFCDSLAVVIAYGLSAVCFVLSPPIFSTLSDAAQVSYITLGQQALPWIRHLNVLPLLVVLLAALLNLNNCYRSIHIQGLRSIARSTAVACIMLCCTLMILLLFFFPLPRQHLGFLVIFHIILWVLIMLHRLMLTAWIKRAHSTGKFQQQTLIVGTNEQALSAARLFDANMPWGIRVIGFLSDDHSEVREELAGHTVLGRVDELPDVLMHNVVDCVYFAGGLTSLTDIRQLALQCEAEGIDFAYSSSAIGRKSGSLIAERLDGLPVVQLRPLGHSPEKLFFKRLIDIAGSACLIVLFLPVWIIVPVLIRRDSAGPVFFNQERVGRNGRRFNMHKFRSMVVDADDMQTRLEALNEMDGPVFKIEHDPRITRLGHFLRKSSIDELPQLFNVLKGEMSLVGPRPPLFKEVMKYYSWQKKRLAVAPGMTCLWQVSGRNNILFDEWVKLDIQYIEHWSLTLDFMILLQTIPAVLSRRGAR